MKKRVNSVKGFSLVELLAALLITGILLATISSVFLISQKVYMRGEAISYKQKSITNVETELQNVLAIATAVNKKIRRLKIRIANITLIWDLMIKDNVLSMSMVQNMRWIR